MEYVLGTLLLIALVVYGINDAKKKKEELRNKSVIIRKYKVASRMEADINKMERLGWYADHTTAAPGFVTGTRSYTVIYKRKINRARTTSVVA